MPVFRPGHLAAIVAVLVISSASAADADTQNGWPTRIEPSPNAPVVLTRCTSYPLQAMMGSGSPIGVSDAVNRSNKFLISYTIRWTLYDHEGSVMGQSTFVYSPKESLAPGDALRAQNVQLAGAFSNIQTTEPLSALGSVSCRLQAATFEGNREWAYGKPWNGKLSPLPRPELAANGGGDGAPTQTNGAPPRFGLNVTNAWNDMVQGSLVVHCAIDIQGGSSDATLTPQMLVLTMQLANGAKKTYGAMTQAAPTYQKLNPLGQTTQTAYEVDPKNDLGAIGSIIVPAHGAVHIIATFLVGTDVVADPNANRQVALQ